MKVYITPECHAEIMHYVHKSSVEISGLGRIEKNSKGEMVVTKVYLLEQENGATSTDIDKDAVAKLMFESRMDPGHLNFWWHSHVNMGVFWSGTDMSTIEEFGKNGFLLATVFNKKGEHRTAYYQGPTDFLPSLFIDQIETSTMYLPTKEKLDHWNSEYEAKAKEKKWASTHYYQGDEKYERRAWGTNVHGIGGYADEPAEKIGKPAPTVSELKSKVKEVEEGSQLATDRVKGECTGMTVGEMCAKIRHMYFESSAYPATTAGLMPSDLLLLYDIWDFVYTDEPTEEDIEWLYGQIVNNSMTMHELVYDLSEMAFRETYGDAAEDEEEIKRTYQTDEYTTEPVALKGAASEEQ